MRNVFVWLGHGATSLLVVAAGCALALEPEAGPALNRMTRIFLGTGLAVMVGSLAYASVRRALGVN